MAWTATENFDSYADEGELNGASGGSNWTGNWSVDGGNGKFLAESAVSYQGANACKFANNADDQMRRTFSNASGIMHIAIRSTAVTLGPFIAIRGDTDSKYCCRLRMQSGGALEVEAASNISLGTYTTNTWYAVHIEVDSATDQVRARLDADTSWSAWVNFYLSNTVTSIDTIWISGPSTSGTGTGYADDIRAGSDPAPAAAASVTRRMLRGIGT